jgi:predicted molibdopterin-dependent oxidoreductase YjgC
VSESERIPASGDEWIEFRFDGEAVRSRRGESIAAALIAAGVDAFGSDASGAPRGPYCNMGTCFECVLTVDDAPLTRSCLTTAESGQDVRREQRW